MKNRIVSLLLALGLLLAVAVPAQAAEAPAYRLKGIPMLQSYLVYDNGGVLPTAVVDDNGLVIQTMTYNAAGQLVQATNGDSPVNDRRFNQTYSYDADGHMTESLLEEYFDGQTVTTREVYAWENGLMTRKEEFRDIVPTPGSDAQESHSRRVVEFTYDGQFRVGEHSISYNGDKKESEGFFRNEPDENGNCARTIRVEDGQDVGVEDTFDYDEQGRRVAMHGTFVSTYDTYADPILIKITDMVNLHLVFMSVEVLDASGTLIYKFDQNIRGEPTTILDENGCVSVIRYVPDAGNAAEGEMQEMELLYEPVTD